MCADTTGPLAGITPENVINPPSCSGVDYIKNNRDEAVRETVNGLVDGLGKQCDAYFAWEALSTLSRIALENVYDGINAPMAHQTRGCLIRRGLIETTAQAPTLWGREVVVEARRRRAFRNDPRHADDPDPTEDQCYAALQAWREAVRVEDTPVRFVSSPGYTGVAVYEWLIAKYGAMKKPCPLESERTWQISESRSTLTTMSFVDPDVAPDLGQTVTEVDVNAQYLGAARSAELGDGEPDEYGGLTGDDLTAALKAPGYVLLGETPKLDGLPQTARLPFAAVEAGWCLPNPAAWYLVKDHGVTLDVAGAIVWPRHGRQTRFGRRLNRWCEVFAEGRAALSARANRQDPHDSSVLALSVLKLVYATFLGGMTRSRLHNDKSTLRPDWHDQYVTLGSVNALRALDKAAGRNQKVNVDTPRLPIGMMKDAAWFVDDTGPIKPEGMDFVDQPGKWHVNRWGPVTEDIVRFHQRAVPDKSRGRPRAMPGRLRSAVKATHDARVAEENQR